MMSTEAPEPPARWSGTRMVFWIVLIAALLTGVVSWFRYTDTVVPVLAEER